MQNQEINTELNFIDIVAVLITHRRLIAVITLGTFVFAVLLFYLFPLWGISITKNESYTAEVNISMPAFSTELQEEMNFPIGETSLAYARNPQVIAKIYKNYITSIGPVSEQELIATIRNNVLGKSLKIEFSEQNNILSISYTSSSPETAENMLRDLVAEIQNLVADEIRSRITSIADDLGAAVDLTSSAIANAVKPSGSSAEVLDGLNTALSENVSLLLEANAKEAEIRRQLASSKFPWRSNPIFTVYISSVNRSRLLQTIVLVFIAFFISVFLSFISEYIFRVKNNENEMKKIREAWNRKK